MEMRDIAKDFVISHFNVPEEFFDTAWNFINENFEKISSLASSSTGINALEGTMAFGGSEERGAVKAILIFADGFRELPLKSDLSDFVDSIRGACSKYHAEEGLTREILKKVNSIENRIAKFMKPEAEVISVSDRETKPERQRAEGEKKEYARIWSNETKPEGDGIDEERFNELIENRENYKIFVIDRGEYEMGSVGEVYLNNQLILKQEDSGKKKIKKKEVKDYLTPYEYKLFVYTLKNKFRAGTVIELVEKCWGKKALVEGPEGLREDLKKDKDTFVRKTSTYRKTIANLSNLLCSYIGVRLRSYRTGSYNLTGKPRFCLLRTSI